MGTSLLIKETESFAIETFRRAKDLHRLKETHVAFSGAPRKHPSDPYRVILITDPFSRNTSYYEFKIDDISFVEELPSLVNLDEEIIPIMRIWVAKGRIALRCTPFIVDDTI